MRPVDTNADQIPLVVELSAAEFRDRLQEALAIYVAAMGYPRGTEYHRAPMWTEHVQRSGWSGVGAVVPADPSAESDATHRLVAVAYGYRGAPEQWWHQQVRTGLRHTGWTRDRIDTVLDDYFELTELHVHPDAQGHGLGETLLLRLLDRRPERGVLLSTPEVADENNRAWRLYRRLGFRDVLRHFRFAGDNRPFAVLGRSLPLESLSTEKPSSGEEPLT
ncbi:GNAT family N-acetyltransferase [Rhodococcus oxybenzonivorans]|uniref:GNAT family N-acetyltransferase n=1 Tax=Rhodococcus oxybenzonivorans TaxID=1990687 RepID=A0A2S2BUH9_9NOCA|nr:MULTISPECIES: GNAT family N-acetyltransferase [Rhodococcus]AWK72253.1 GNAT family N-acetyltransferase [Rhodococcus oxybenzonivorans]QTJ64692.1 GNAT family N-acetyltransferase [Rhodococcus sp. ZPP]